MAPLTWRNVDAPSFAGVNDALRLASQNFNTGFDALGKSLGDFQDGRITKDSNAAILDVMKYQDPEAYKAALASGTVGAGVNPRNLNADALNFMNNHQRDLISNQQSGANLTGTNIANTGAQFSNDQLVSAAGREDAKRAAMPAAEKVMAQMQQLARSGTAEGLAAAQKMAADNNDLLISAGLSTNSVINGLDSSLTAGIGSNNNINANTDSLKARYANQKAETIVSDLRKNSGSLEEAKLNAQKAGLPTNVLRPVLADLESNADAYFAKPQGGAYETLFAPEKNAKASLINNESGGNFKAKNDVQGSGGKGHFGRAQFSQGRLQEAKNAGVMPKSMTPEEFLNSPNTQKAVEDWHFNDIDQKSKRSGLDQYYGKVINGVTINRESIRSMAHIGGFNGAKRFIESGGSYNPADVNGTTLKDYGQRHGGPGNSGGNGNQQAAPAPNQFDVTQFGTGSPFDIAGATNPNSLTGPTPPAPQENPVVNDPSINGNSKSNYYVNKLAEFLGQDTAAGTTPAPAPAAPITGDTGAPVDINNYTPSTPTPSAQAVPVNNAVQTLKNTQTVDTVFNNLQAIDTAFKERPNKNETTASTVKRLREGELSSVPESALTTSINEIQSKYGVPADIAGVMAAQAVEARDVSSWKDWIPFTGGPSDSFGKAVDGTNFAPRINMDVVDNIAKAYKEATGSDISKGVARQSTLQNSDAAVTTITQLQAADAQVEAEYASAQAQAAINPNINMEYYTKVYKEKKAKIQDELAKISAKGALTAFSKSNTGN